MPANHSVAGMARSYKCQLRFPKIFVSNGPLINLSFDKAQTYITNHSFTEEHSFFESYVAAAQPVAAAYARSR